MSTLALAVILYLGYASFVLLKIVCVLCLITYAAVIGLFLVSGAATSFPMTTLPRRAVARPPGLRLQPAGADARRPVLGRRRLDARVLPARGRDRRRRAGEAAAASTAPEPTQNQRSEFERWYSSQPRVPLIVPTEGAKVLVVKFNDYQCPACGTVVHAVQADPREVPGGAAGRRAARAEGLSAQPRLQRRARPDDSPGRLRRRGRGAPRARRTSARRWRSGSTRTSRR